MDLPEVLINLATEFNYESNQKNRPEKLLADNPVS
jgi:hypothetical protein